MFLLRKRLKRRRDECQRALEDHINMSETLRRYITVELTMAQGDMTEENTDYALRITLEATSLILEALPTDLFLTSNSLLNVRRMVIDESRKRIKAFVSTADDSPIGISSADLKCLYNLGKVAI